MIGGRAQIDLMFNNEPEKLRCVTCNLKTMDLVEDDEKSSKRVVPKEVIKEVTTPQEEEDEEEKRVQKMRMMRS